MDYRKGDSNDVYTRNFVYDDFMKSDRVLCIAVSNDYIDENNKGDNKIDIEYDKFDILFKNKYGKLIKKTRTN